jgi:hypothetical protein
VRKFRFHGRHILQASDAKYHFVAAQVQFTKSFNDSHSIMFCTELGQQRKTLGESCVLEQSLRTSGPRAFFDREFLFILVVFNKQCDHWFRINGVK